jgi:UPF0755 protein
MRRLFAVALLGLAAVLAAAGWAWWQYARAPLPLAQAEVQVEIDRGMAGQAIAAALRRQGVAVPDWLFAAALRLRGDGPKIRAGNYELTGPITLAALLDRLTRGRVRRGTAVSPQAQRYAAEVETIARIAWREALKV